MNYHWHIDGWDRLSGRAFATQRPSGVDLSEWSEHPSGTATPRWGPTIYIGPPGFQPEVLANASIALSAARFGQFQPRLPRDGAEISFPSAESVAEFVRRAFVGGGRGGGGPLEGETTPPRDPEGPIEGPDLEGASPLQSYPASYQKALKFLYSMSPGKDNTPWPDAVSIEYQPAFQIGLRQHAVSAGAATLAATMLRAHSSYRQNKRLRLWRGAARNLCRAITELDLFVDWAGGANGVQTPTPITNILSRVVRDLLRVQVDSKSLSKMVFFLLRDHLDDNELFFIKRVSDRVPWPWYFLPQSGSVEPLTDRYDALFTWPLPAHIVDAGNQVFTVGDLLAVFVASPMALKQQVDAYDILEFAAALLASRIPERVSPNWREDAARSWFERSRPRWAFSSQAENLLLDGVK
jgi:hypothetical protein